MFCLKCGKEIENGAKFCPHCGAVTSAGAGSAPSAPRGDWDTPQEGKKRRGIPLIIGGVAAVVLVVALIAAAIGGLFSSPQKQVEKAVAKTIAAYAEASGKTGIPDLTELVQGRSYSQEFSVALGSISQELTGWYDLSALKGLGARVGTDYDQKGRKMDAEIAVFWDDQDLASFQMLVDGGKISVSSPDFTKGNAYGIDTETLGADLDRLGLEDDDIDVKKIGFNIFDLMDKAVPDEQQTKEMKSAAEEASKELFNALEVEKVGKQSVQVNGKSTDAILYQVVIPKSAMKDYLNAMEDVMKMTDTVGMTKEILLAMGFDKSTVNEILSEMDSADVYGELFSGLKELVKTIGDVELQVYVSGGYVCAVEYSDRIEGTKVELELYLGGGSNYVDDLSLEIAVNGEKITVESSGDHAGKSGVFTDETTIKVDGSRLTSELRYAPKSDKNNFEWTLKIDNSASLSMEGQLTTGKNSIDLHLEDLSVKAAGSKLLSLELDYYLGPCKGMRVSHSAPKMLLEMDEDDLMDLMEDLEDNAEDWVYDLRDRLPASLLNSLYW